MIKCDCETLIQEIEMLKARIEALERGGGTRRSKRAPSKYNLFMKECIKGKSGPIQERFRACALEYKKHKGQ